MKGATMTDEDAAAAISIPYSCSSLSRLYSGLKSLIVEGGAAAVLLSIVQREGEINGKPLYKSQNDSSKQKSAHWNEECIYTSLARYASLDQERGKSPVK